MLFRSEGKIGRVYYPAPYMTNENLDYYVDAYEVGFEAIIDTYAVATQHVDQGLSLTLFYPDTVTTRDLNKSYIYAWRKGIKTMYYVRLRQMALEGTEVAGCGQKIAAIDDRRALLEVQKSEDEFKQRELDLQDVLVGMGYSPHDKSDIPADKLALACIKSGYNIAESNYKQAQLRLKHVCLTAPISGVVADLHTQEHTIPESSKPSLDRKSVV